MAASDAAICPICCEDMDEQDLSFFPCECGYQVCMFCWKKIRFESNSKCPACRTEYTEEKVTFKARTDPKLSAAERRRKKATKKAAGRKVVPAAVIGSSPALRDKLRQMRVVQRNLVYVVGLPLDIAKETTLKRREYFGQYGKVLKIVVNRKIGESSGRGDSACAYVTYANPDHARIAILCTDGFNFRRRPIKSMFGTTKYCHQFLAGRGCNNPDCMYLHSIAEGENSFTKDQMQSGRTFTNIVQPGRGPDNPANDVYTAAGFPPSSFASMARKGEAHAAGAGDAVSTPDPATDVSMAGSAATSAAAARTSAPPNAWKTGASSSGGEASQSKAPTGDALSERAARFRQQQAAARPGSSALAPAPAPVPATATGNPFTYTAAGRHRLSRRGPTTAIGLLSCASGLFLPLRPTAASEKQTPPKYDFALHKVPPLVAKAISGDSDLLLPKFRQLTGGLAQLGPGSSSREPLAAAAWLNTHMTTSSR